MPCSLVAPQGGTRPLNRPERECFPGFYAGIPVVKKIELAMVTGPGERDPFSESQGAEGTGISLEFDLNEYAVLAALLSDRKDFCRDASHKRHFPGLAPPETISARNASGPEQEPVTIAQNSDEVELFLHCNAPDQNDFVRRSALKFFVRLDRGHETARQDNKFFISFLICC